ncbi:Heterokaryon incompatibility protein (HET) domain containing protein [Rhypophila sp. PSN 637]
MSDTASGGVETVDSTMTEESSGLCDVCVGVPFVEMLAYSADYHRKNDRKHLYKELGPLEDVMKKDSCPLCRLFVRALFPGDGEEKSLDSETLRLKCEIYSLLGDDWDVSGPELHFTLSGGSESGDHEASIRPHHEDYNTWAREMAMQRNIEPYVAAEDAGLARPINDTIDIPLVRSWLDICENEHSGTCDLDLSRGTHSKPTSVAPAIFPIILIDVCQRRLIIQDSTARYTTLSYVWGPATMLKTTQANLAPLGEEDALRDRDDVPRVIQDAMAFVELLGEKYLWVDALCIIQDQDTDSLEACLARMDRIYNLSVLTLVALSGDSADAPLPGVQPGSRPAGPKFESIRGLRCAPTIPDLPEVARESRYATRGWTFQETLLSRRRLFFAPNQVFFECCKGIRSEGRSGVQLVNYWSNPLAGGAFSDFISYANLVQKYTRRYLSHESDVCRAFSGMASFLGAPVNDSAKPTKFVANIPYNYFLPALLWYPDVDLQRRSGGEHDTFPSWSWAGWKGHMGRIGSVKYDFWGEWRVQPETDRYKIQSCVDATLITDQAIDHVLYPENTTKRHDGPCSVHLEFDTHSRPGLEPMPAFGLPILEVRAHQTKASQFGYSPMRDPFDFEGVDILDASGRHCGVLAGGTELSPRSVTEPGNRIMLLGVKEAIKDKLDEELMGEYYRSMDMWCGNPDSPSNVGCIFFVILVGKRDQVFERLAVGVIHPEAWKEVEFKVESVLLA